MPNHTGDEGVVKIGSNVVAEIRSWSLSHSVGTREDTVMGDTFRTFIAGKQEWSASLEVFWDETDTNGQEAMTVGSTVALNLFPEGDASTDVFFAGSGIVESVERSADQEGMVEASITVKGTGALTQSTVT